MFLNNAIGQCANDGQNPSTADKVCGSVITPHGNVPSCKGTEIPIPPSVCSSVASVYTDVNSFYYTFDCYTSGPLEFTITPNNLGDDYDWQLFDITGKIPNDIYNASLVNSIFVACNWSGNTGVTGTSLTATQQNSCEGSTPNITKAPNLIQGHTYLLMVSHFTASNQSGYNIQFNGNTASLITDPNNPVPKVDTVTAPCGGNTIHYKLNKQIKCNSIDVSDFVISTNPTIAAFKGFGCVAATSYTDSIVVTLANPLPIGSYTTSIKVGTDLNTFVDVCLNELVAGTHIKTFSVYYKPTPTIITQIIKETCKADTLKYSHNGNNGTTKWQWTFDGNPTTSTQQSQQVVYTNFITRKVKLVVSSAFCSDSTTQTIPIVDHTLTAKFGVSRDTTCPNNPETFTDSTVGNINSWNWNFGNGQLSTSPNPNNQVYPILPINKIYTTRLIVSNAFGCIDSTTHDIFVRGTIPTEFDSIIPPACAASEIKIYFRQAMICGSVAPDGSDFSISGATPNSIIGANISCVNGVGTVVTLLLASALVTGNYQLSLKVGNDANTIINDCGIATLPKTLVFAAFGHINTSFKYDSVLGCKVDTLIFHHIINNGANSWMWAFDGNPTISNLQNIKVAYSDFTKRDVQLIVGNGICFDTSKIISLPIVDHSLFANFGSPDTTCGNGSTVFTDSSKGVITNWYWSFGNGKISNAKNPAPVNFPLSYVYTTSPIQLIVKNSVGCFDTTKVKDIIIKPSAPAKMINIDDLPCSADSIILHFNAPMLCNTVAPDGSDFSITGTTNIAIASASIINCSNGFGRNVVIKLTAPISVGGTYTLNLKRGTDFNTILNDCGIETAPAYLGFVAFTKVNATFIFTNKIDCVEDTLFLNHTIDNQENKWIWTINGTAVGNVNNYVLPYNQSNIKRIKLIVANPVCSDTSTQIIPLVFDVVKAGFTMSQDIICPTETITFKDSSNGNSTSWDWSFGNGLTSTDKNPTARTYTLPAFLINTGHNYQDYLVTLVVANATPCYDTARKTIRVTSNCLVQVATAFTPNSDGRNDNLYPLNAYKATNLKFRVYNRLGQIVFDSKNNYSWWDGTVNGIKQPAGTYIWQLEYTDKATGNNVSLNGTSVLIR